MAPEDGLTTEAINPSSVGLDGLDALAIVELMAAEDARAVAAVAAEKHAIAAAVDLAEAALRKGGRLIYVGAGTSGRLGVLDASECPPTFGTDPGTVVGIIAGGLQALTRSIEGAEDCREDGETAIDDLGVNADDLVVGIAASGRTPFVLSAVERAKRRGAKTVGIACNRPSSLGEIVDVEISPVVGPEIIAGSTRLKAGTATKFVLNAISTGAMVRIGKTLGNRMVDLRPWNRKIEIRSRRILREVAGLSEEAAVDLLRRADGRLKTALVAAIGLCTIEEADRRLEASGGRVAPAVEARP